MYLVISRSCEQSRHLLVWIKDNRSRLCPGILAGLRVLDVDTMACKAIARRVHKVPCLILPTKKRSTVAGVQAVAAYLLSGSVHTEPSSIQAAVQRGTRSRPRAARTQPTRPTPQSHTQSGWRENKKKQFDSDMEALLAQRKALGYEPPTRV